VALSKRKKIAIGIGIFGSIGAATALMYFTRPAKAAAANLPKPGDLVSNPDLCRQAGLIALPYPPEPGKYMCERR
jgi:hypothetical protein